jgi:hypothetical protein
MGTDEKIAQHMEPFFKHRRTLRAGNLKGMAALAA